MTVPWIGELNWRDWITGVVGGFIGGGAGAVTSAVSMLVVDPNYVATHGANILKIMSMTFLVSGLLGAALYLKQHPTPDVITTTTKTERTEVREEPAATITTKIEQQKVEPVATAQVAAETPKPAEKP